MRVHEIICPKCRAGLKSKAGVPVGQTLSCPKCKNKFVVEAPEEPEEADILDDTQVIEVEDERPPRKKGPPPPPPKRKKAATREDEPTEEIQLPKTKKTVKAQRDDDEDDEDEEEEERKPKKKKKKKKHYEDEEEENLFLRLKHNILVRIITMVILLTILAVAAYLLYEKHKAEAQDANRGPAQVATIADVDLRTNFG